ncbi:hypothetical protein P171DRAFT_519891 [Karstenula rhodostoma CBS 690.94]|uniref:Uncharacterized protein n=1 Tax=Karstenula rhodostoma CBS 690.94 TaxID=1392251 RepID=A0A9P4PN81_9PLEO|nr:hypothetical protein P171DRAFT_519891 [Karstenula rhodostoma CBS 690.94]
MDAQIMGKFFREVFEQHGTSLKPELPDEFMSNERGITITNKNVCSTIRQFWHTRWPKGDDAMTCSQYTPEWSTRMSWYSYRDESIIEKTLFSASELIDNLREVVLLAKYLNTPKIAKAFKEVSSRISTRLMELEDGISGKPAHIRQTDDYWFKKNDDEALKDKPTGKYRSLGLSEKWDTFIYGLVRHRTQAMHTLQMKYFHDLETQYREMKTWKSYKALPRRPRALLEKRMMDLRNEIDVKIHVDGLVSRPAHMPPSSGSGSPNASPRRASTGT